MISLETERLVLRPPEAEDADALAPMYADPDVMRYVGDGRTFTPEETARSVQRMMDGWEADGFGLFTTVRKEDETIIGRVGLIVWNPETWQEESERRRADRARGRLHARQAVLGPGLRDGGGRRRARLRDREARSGAADRADHPRQRRLRERGAQARLRVRARHRLRPAKRPALRAGPVRLETERLLLRKPERSDLDGYTAVFGDPKVTRFLGRGGARTPRGGRERPRLDDPPLGAARDRRSSRSCARRTSCCSAASASSSGTRSAGSTRCTTDPQGPTETELGWTLGHAHWNQGYATEGAIVVPRLGARRARPDAAGLGHRPGQHRLDPRRREDRRDARARGPARALRPPVGLYSLGERIVA